MKGDNKGRAREATLDPDDWAEMRALGHRMMDDMLDHLEHIRTKPVRPPTKKDVEDVCVPLTEDGEGEELVYEVFKRSILPHTLLLPRPNFWGLVGGQGSPYGMMAEMLMAATNGGQEFSFAEARVNAQVIEWIKQMVGFPKTAGGVLVGGGSEANFTGLAVARNAKAQVDVKVKGLQGLTKRMTLYCGDETHHCLERSVELLGLGNEAMRFIPTDEECRIRSEVLEKTIKQDRRNGCQPFCVIGCAGTVNTGAFDDLDALADIARREKLWFHVDGAFGAWLKISRTHKHLVKGMDRADSLAVDFHKWMNMPYAIGCTLVKDRKAHFSTFAYGHEAEYLKSAFEVSNDQLTNPHNLALPLSRAFTSLKAYMLLRAYGTKKYSDLVQKNLDQMKRLGDLIESDPDLELAAPVASNIVCFRYRASKLGKRETELLNRMIIEALNKEAFLMISDTTVKGEYMLRAANVNHRTRMEDLEAMIASVKENGRRLLPEMRTKKTKNVASR